MVNVLPLCFGLSVAGSTEPQTFNIFPVGDSNTLGYDTAYGAWRHHLYDLLVDAEFDFNYVGSIASGEFAADNDHDGVTGDVVNGAWGRILERLLPYEVDIVLLMIGTNDVGFFQPDNNVTLTTYEHLLDSIVSLNPNVVTFVGSIPPIDPIFETQADVDEFNDGLEALVATYDPNKFIFVDINAGLDLGDLVDGLHLTNPGYDKIADMWFAAIQAYYIGGALVTHDTNDPLIDNDDNPLLAI